MGNPVLSRTLAELLEFEGYQLVDGTADVGIVIDGEPTDWPSSKPLIMLVDRRFRWQTLANEENVFYVDWLYRTTELLQVLQTALARG